jgi:NAD(P)-dependent dehydrogenase (short-subunit alcohol dehydrogenase family)
MRKQFQSNLFGTMAFTQPFITHFRTRHAGHIINISSYTSVSCSPAWSIYGATKSALDTFSDVLAKELSLFGVRVSIVMPGYFPTDIFLKNPSYDKDGAGAQIPLSTIYTDPVTQGYNTVSTAPQIFEALGEVGDIDKLAMRVFEIGAGIGLSEQVMEPHLVAGWIRIPCGTDSAQRLISKWQDNIDNVKAYEAIWRSTDKEIVKR